SSPVRRRRSTTATPTRCACARWPSGSRPTPASRSRTPPSNCTGDTVISRSTASNASRATFGCTRSWRARTRSCDSSSAAVSSASDPEDTMEPMDDEVLVRRAGRLGHLILNRPKAMNALTRPMVRRMASALDAWETDAGVETVLLTGAGDRGLCAGGDIVGMYHDALSGGSESRLFWRDEYHLNARIGGYPKPYVAFMDGVVLGGGIGVS